MPTKKSPKIENQPSEPTKAEELITNEIASRYLDSIPHIADQVASEFWSRMDTAVAEAIVKQLPEKFVRLRFKTSQTVDTKVLEGR